MTADDPAGAPAIAIRNNGAGDGASSGALFRRCRHALGLSAAGMAQTLHIADGRTIRRWEAGERDVPGPAWVALAFLLRHAGERALADELDRVGNGP